MPSLYAARENYAAGRHAGKNNLELRELASGSVVPPLG
jgi:hypothetical protein